MTCLNSLNINCEPDFDDLPLPWEKELGLVPSI